MSQIFYVFLFYFVVSVSENSELSYTNLEQFAVEEVKSSAEQVRELPKKIKHIIKQLL